MKERIFEKLLIYSIIIMIITVGITFIPLKGLFNFFLDDMSAEFIVAVLEQTGVSVLLIVLISKLGLYEKAGFKGRVQKLLLIWPGLLYILNSAQDWILGKTVIDTRYPVHIIFYILMYMSTGLFEV